MPGVAAWLRHGCGQCHVLDGISPPLSGSRRAAPTLPAGGAARSRAWHLAHLRSPRTLSPDSLMPAYPSLFTPSPREADLAAILGRYDRADPDGIVTAREYARGGGSDWEALLARLDATGDRVLSGADAAPTPSCEASALAEMLSAAGVPPGGPPDPPPSPERQPGERRAAALRGHRLFLRLCAGCHGTEGRGDGPAAPFFAESPPRNLRRGEFRFRSTLPPLPPRDEDLFRTIRWGLGGSMPGWPDLAPGQVWDLVEHVKTLHPLWVDGAWEEGFDPSGEEVPVGTPPFPYTAESAEIGARVYVEFGCGGCHGVEGRGDGEAALSGRGPLGEVIRPADYTTGRFRGGGDARSLVRVFLTGLQGTPMPSYAHQFAGARSAPPAEAPWRLAHHVLRQAGFPFEK